MEESVERTWVRVRAGVGARVRVGIRVGVGGERRADHREEVVGCVELRLLGEGVVTHHLDDLELREQPLDLVHDLERLEGRGGVHVHLEG